MPWVRSKPTITRPERSPELSVGPSKWIENSRGLSGRPGGMGSLTQGIGLRPSALGYSLPALRAGWPGNWEFRLQFREGHVTLSGQSVCDYDADLGRKPFDKALERLLRDGESEVYEVVASHTHSYGRDEVRSYDKECFGLTPGEYLRRCRLDRARWLLRRSSAGLADIAAATGFTDQSHFSNAFRKGFGVSPEGLSADLIRDQI